MKNITSRKQCPPPTPLQGAECLPLNHQHHHFLHWGPYLVMNHPGKDLASPLARLGKSKLVTAFVPRPKPKIKVYRKINTARIHFFSLHLSLSLEVWVGTCCRECSVWVWSFECACICDLAQISVCTDVCRGHRRILSIVSSLNSPNLII